MVKTLRPRQDGWLFFIRHFEVRFLQSKYLNFDWNITKVCSDDSIVNTSALVQEMAWHRAGDKPLSESILTVQWHTYATTCLNILTLPLQHYSDVIMSAMASEIVSITIVYSTVYSGSDQRKHQSYASLAFVWGIHWWPVNSPHKGPVTRKMFPIDDVIMG